MKPIGVEVDTIEALLLPLAFLVVAGAVPQSQSLVVGHATTASLWAMHAHPDTLAAADAHPAAVRFAVIISLNVRGLQVVSHLQVGFESQVAFAIEPHAFGVYVSVAPHIEYE